MRSFLDYIQFKYIPCDVLVKDVYPLKIVPNYTMIRALAHQADPTLQVYIERFTTYTVQWGILGVMGCLVFVTIHL